MSNGRLPIAEVKRAAKNFFYSDKMSDFTLSDGTYYMLYGAASRCLKDEFITPMRYSNYDQAADAVVSVFEKLIAKEGGQIEESVLE